MKKLKSIILIAVIALLGSCATTVEFPVSSTVPGAAITVKKSKDKNGNYSIEIIAKNLASPERLSPPKNNYSVWLTAENGSTNNIGQLINKNASKAILKTSTPFDPKEIFITAEEKGNLNYPNGTEISRVSFNK